MFVIRETDQAYPTAAFLSSKPSSWSSFARCQSHSPSPLNPPYALPLPCRSSDKSERHILVFDLGGGTFDVAVLAQDGGVLEVLATNGDSHLEGEDFDQRLVDYLIKVRCASVDAHHTRPDGFVHLQSLVLVVAHSVPLLVVPSASAAAADYTCRMLSPPLPCPPVGEEEGGQGRVP